MKIATFALVAALAAAPVSALAQVPPGAPGMGGPSSAQMQQMQQMHAAARTKMLAALSPAHKALLARILGNLGTAENPDYGAAAKELDAALTPAEKQAILGVHDAMRKQMESLMKQQHGDHQPPGGAMGHPMHHHSMNDPGAMLLMMSSHPMGPMGPMGGPPH